MNARTDKPIRRILLSNDDGVDAIGLKILYEIGYTGCVSLELYNPMYRKREPQEFLKEAHTKTLAVIKQALNSA